MDGRQVACYPAGSESEVRERESGEEMMLTIVTAGTVCYLRHGGHVFRPVCLLVVKITQTLLDRFQ